MPFPPVCSLYSLAHKTQSKVAFNADYPPPQQTYSTAIRAPQMLLNYYSQDLNQLWVILDCCQFPSQWGQGSSGPEMVTCLLFAKLRCKDFWCH
ncbi:hypothetical protein XELAEV_18046976mg [Xenopus laevis]|uniref:Uncharacterized protein n=1 Tax=Xenopus laevis TaxID=8355 RepID=A0A974H1D2_XENLA|nr:hypothetical protein XELAEV_18046976mg [Xenopus laevis]